jgi:hypothetical protein
MKNYGQALTSKQMRERGGAKQFALLRRGRRPHLIFHREPWSGDHGEAIVIMTDGEGFSF